MLTLRTYHRPLNGLPHQQRGVVLFIALIVLVAMTLGGIALVRSVDLTNIIAGNLAFRQAAVHAADRGIENAINWLQTNNTAGFLDTDHSDEGYSANGSDALRSPSAGQTWRDYWATLVAAGRVKHLDQVVNPDGNEIYYVVDRMCSFAQSPTSGGDCAESLVVATVPGNEEKPGLQITVASGVYYRITVRVEGPRNTVSFIQAMVSL